MERQQYKHEDVFPIWVPAVFGALAVINSAVVIHQRYMEGHGLLRPVLLVCLVLLPYALEGLSVATGKRFALPRVLFAFPVLIGTALLVWRPSQIDFAPFVLVLLAASMAADSEGSPWLGVGVALAAIGVMVGIDMSGRFQGAFIWVIGITFGWFGGASVGALSVRTHELKRANEELSEKSAAEERQRIAREIHDVIAHSMSVTMLHVTAARMSLEKGSTEPALEALREAEQQGRRSLGEIRRTVGLLGPDDGASAPPAPSASDLPNLISDFRNAGLDVSFDASGDLTSLAPATGLAIYRVVQESLTNAAKHAPGAPVRVELDVDGDVRLRVHNPITHDAPAGEGLGLRGMAERAALLGGTLETSNGSSGWTVTLIAPRQPTASA